MSGREEIGHGDLLRDAWQHFLDVLADFEWGRKDVYPLRDRFGYYAVVGTLLWPGQAEQPMVVLTARRIEYSQWSVTAEPWRIVQKHNGWLVGYFNDSGRIVVFDPAKSTGTSMRREELTYEFNTADGIPLKDWLRDPQLRTKQAKLG